jgi:HD-GYP domain-containing protein (c-di-GMP phosphodiesterase class II)
LCSASAGLLFFEPDPRQATSAPKCLGEGAERILERHRAALMAVAERVRRDPKGTLMNEHDLAAADLAGPVEGFGNLGSLVAAPLLAQSRTAGVVVGVRASHDTRFGQEDLRLLLSLARQAGIAIDNAHLIESEKNFFTHVTQLLVGALDRFANHQPGHSRRVAHYAVVVGREMGLDPARCERLFFAALLHDIGMLRLADGGVMSHERYREHPRFGYEMIQPITLWSDLAPMVLHHQERFDGQGYPEGQKGEEIPVEARIIGLVEAFDTMTSRHSYRVPRPVPDVMREIGELAGKQFDPKAVAALAALVARGEVEVSEA